MESATQAGLVPALVESAKARSRWPLGMRERMRVLGVLTSNSHHLCQDVSTIIERELAISRSFTEGKNTVRDVRHVTITRSGWQN